MVTRSRINGEPIKIYVTLYKKKKKSKGILIERM